MSDWDEAGCAEVAERAAELALGALLGHERARVLAHLDRCGRCQEDVRQLMVTADALLELLPGSEPPLGFESRVLALFGLSRAVSGASGRARPAQEEQDAERTGAGTAVPRRAFACRRVVAVAACLAAVAGAWMAGGAMRSPLPPSSPLLRSAALISPAGHAVGQIFVYAGSPGWLYVQVDTGPGNRVVTCQVTGGDGRVATIGEFWLASGHGTWGSPDGADSSWLSGARLVTGNETVVATAAFTGT